MVFIPFLVQSIFCIMYFSITLQDQKHHITFWGVIAEISIIALSIFFLWLEKEAVQQGSVSWEVLSIYTAHIQQASSCLSLFSLPGSLCKQVSLDSSSSWSSDRGWRAFTLIAIEGSIWKKGIFIYKSFSFSKSKIKIVLWGLRIVLIKSNKLDSSNSWSSDRDCFVGKHWSNWSIM